MCTALDACGLTPRRGRRLEREEAKTPLEPESQAEVPATGRLSQQHDVEGITRKDQAKRRDDGADNMRRRLQLWDEQVQPPHHPVGRRMC